MFSMALDLLPCNLIHTRTKSWLEQWLMACNISLTLMMEASSLMIILCKETSSIHTAQMLITVLLLPRSLLSLPLTTLLNSILIVLKVPLILALPTICKQLLLNKDATNAIKNSYLRSRSMASPTQTRHQPPSMMKCSILLSLSQVSS